MISLRNRKSQEMTIGTIIIIILALVVLVLLIMGFSMGWSNLWDKISNLGAGGQSNVDTVVQSCNIACTTNSQYEYCRTRTVNFGAGAEPLWSTDVNKADGKISANCKTLAANGVAGLDACSIACPNKCSNQKDETGKTNAHVCMVSKKESCPAGKVYTEVESDKFTDLDSAAGDVCCKVACTIS